MKTKVSPAVVGVFVLGALLLGLMALLSFGRVHFFSKPPRFVVHFDETIHGLDLGSPVKLRGVRVGRVVQINLLFREEENKSIVVVLCEINRDAIRDDRGQELDISNRARLEELIDRGLRAQLGVLGLATGLLYVELDFVDPAEHPEPEQEMVPVDYALVPAVRSTISEFQANLSEILTSVGSIDFAGLAGEARSLLRDARGKINAFDAAGLSAEWSQAAQSVHQLAGSGEIERTFNNLNLVIEDLQETLARIDAAVEPTGTELASTLQQARTTLATFNQTALTAQQFITAQSGLGADAAAAFRQLSEAARSVARLVDYLERNPNALLTGRAPRP